MPTFMMMMNDERIVGGEDAPSPIPWQVKSWWSRTTPFATISFKKSYKIFHHILLWHEFINNFKAQGEYFYLLQYFEATNANRETNNTSYESSNTQLDLLGQTSSWGLWQYRLWSFKSRDTKLERLLPKNQHTQRKLLNFENWLTGSLNSLQNSKFLKSF